MCTVTFLPTGNNNFILTSNRDESPKRKTILPKRYIENGVEMIYPKDALAGGTWIGVSEKKRLVCLLNGGFEKHQRKDTYRMSRGIIVKELLASGDFVGFVTDFDFMGIEPFTIVLVDWAIKLTAYELVWDGAKKHFTQLKDAPKIWSSTTLYTEEVKELRRQWFAAWLKKHFKFTRKEILEFHNNASKGSAEIAVKMKRDYVETVSITSVEKNTKKVSLRYLDLNSAVEEEVLLG